jgi:hypothetical protein
MQDQSNILWHFLRLTRCRFSCFSATRPTPFQTLTVAMSCFSPSLVHDQQHLPRNSLYQPKIRPATYLHANPYQSSPSRNTPGSGEAPESIPWCSRILPGFEVRSVKDRIRETTLAVCSWYHRCLLLCRGVVWLAGCLLVTESA